MTPSSISAPPFIVGIGGTTRAGSSTERALGLTLQILADDGCETRLFGGECLRALPHYDQAASERTAPEREFLAAIRRADGLILATPAYHAGGSGLLKNALDLIQDTAKDPRPYLDGLAVGLITTAYGWQAAGAALSALRSIVHALRGWPTPLGVTLNTASDALFTPDGACTDPRVAEQLATMARQVTRLARAEIKTRDGFAVADSATL